MNRRSFLRTVLGAAAAVAVAPKIPLPEAAPEYIAYKGMTVEPFEAEFCIASQEIIDAMVLRTAWYWNELALENLKTGARKAFQLP